MANFVPISSHVHVHKLGNFDKPTDQIDERYSHFANVPNCKKSGAPISSKEVLKRRIANLKAEKNICVFRFRDSLCVFGQLEKRLIMDRSECDKQDSFGSLNQNLLSAPLESVPAEPPHMLRSSLTVRQVMDFMREKNVPALLVCEHQDGPVQGVLTERDVLRVFELGWNPDKRTIREIMRPNPFCYGPWDSIGFALRKLVEEDCSHVPVIDLDGRPTGLLSRRQLLNFISTRVSSASNSSQPDLRT